jgi:DNA-binding NarL/FixJ family response regulator
MTPSGWHNPAIVRARWRKLPGSARISGHLKRDAVEVAAGMQARIAVADPLPAFRRGVIEILRDAGFEPEAPEDVLAWVHDEQPKAVVLTIRTDTDWELLERLRHATAGIVLMALLDPVTVESSVRALRAGAVCAVARDASPATIREAFRAAMQGQSLLGVDVLRALTAPAGVSPPDRPSAEERRWLRDLSRGRTVGELAADAGYSERMMFRLLRDLYTRFGATGRTDALIMAQSRGWL